MVRPSRFVSLLALPTLALMNDLPLHPGTPILIANLLV
jgi:hypothetical protein